MIIDLLCIWLGLLFGSFLSVCIYRIPLGREIEPLESENDSEDPSLPPQSEKDAVEPTAADAEKKITIAEPARSFCPHCHHQLYWWHNIPVVSWLLLRGRCWFCKAPISVRYPVVELLSAFFAYLSFVTWGLTPTAVLIYAFCAALIVISFIDYDYYIIPNVISIPGTFIGFGISVLNQFYPIFAEPVNATILDAVYGLLAGGGFLYFVSEVYLRLRKKDGLGMGDVKLLAMTGALFGPQAAIYTIFIGSLFGSILGVLLILFSGRKFSHHLPFGPYLAIGTLMYLFTGDTVMRLLAEGMVSLMSR